MSDARPEPSNVGPIAGGNLRASDADRERVATVLNSAYAEGRISRDEHDERLDQLMVAKTFDDLIPITRDLVVSRPPREDHQTAAAPAAGFDVDTSSASEQPARLVAIFSGVARHGKWRVRRKTQVLALFGGIVHLAVRDEDVHAPPGVLEAVDEVADRGGEPGAGAEGDLLRAGQLERA